MVRSKYMTMFKDCGINLADGLIKAEGGLGREFEAAVKQLLEESSKKTTPEVVAAYDIAISEMEDVANAKLIEAFGEYDHDGKRTTLSRYSPNFRNYKSSYRALLKKLGAEAATLPKLSIAAVKQKVAELNKPADGATTGNKGPNTGNAGGDDASGKTGGNDNAGKAGGNKKHRPLDPEVQKHLDNYAAALANMEVHRALGAVKKAESIAWNIVKEAGGKVAKIADRDAA